MKPIEEDFARLKRLGNRAAEIALDSDFKEIMALLKSRTLRDWAATHPNAVEAREGHYRDILALGRLENYLAELGQQLRAEMTKHDNEARRGQ